MLTAGWIDVVRLPGFWVSCALIFLFNSLIAFFAGFWLLGTLQLLTTLLCAGSVVRLARHRRDVVIRRGDEEADRDPAA